jgi:transposase-like protein
MKRIHGTSKFGGTWYFNDEERGDIYFCVAHQGESFSSVARRYQVSPSVIKRVFHQIVEGSVTFAAVPGEDSDTTSAA